MINRMPFTSLSRFCLREEMLFFLCFPTTASGYLSFITLLHSLKCWILQLIPFPFISTSPGTYSSHFWSVFDTSGSSLPDCIARDSKSLMISTNASLTLMKFANAFGVPGCLQYQAWSPMSIRIFRTYLDVGKKTSSWKQSWPLLFESLRKCREYCNSRQALSWWLSPCEIDLPAGYSRGVQRIKNCEYSHEKSFSWILIC